MTLQTVFLLAIPTNNDFTNYFPFRNPYIKRFNKYVYKKLACLPQTLLLFNKSLFNVEIEHGAHCPHAKHDSTCGDLTQHDCGV